MCPTGTCVWGPRELQSAGVCIEWRSTEQDGGHLWCAHDSLERGSPNVSAVSLEISSSCVIHKIFKIIQVKLFHTICWTTGKKVLPVFLSKTMIVCRYMINGNIVLLVLDV